jgi:hypothetical protein
VDVVGNAELAAADERFAESTPFDHRRGHREADEREPRDRGKHEHAHQERHGKEDEQAYGESNERRSARQPSSGGERAGSHVRRREERRAEPDDNGLGVDRLAERQLLDHGDAEPERKRSPEPFPVEPDRLRHDLADRAGLRRKRRRELATAGHRPKPNSAR